MEFKEKFISFMDILGFSTMVKNAEAGDSPTLPELLEHLKKFGSSEDRNTFEQYGPTVCPESKFHQRNLDFRLTQISDCVIISTEITPSGLINLLHHCHGVVIKLLKSGVLCRGYVTRGNIYHTNTQFLGTGYEKAQKSEGLVKAFRGDETEKGTPFVEIDQKVAEYVRNCGDECVIDMYSRLVLKDGEPHALFPFQRLPPYGFGSSCDLEKEKRNNSVSRQFLETLKQGLNDFLPPQDDRASKKHQYYQHAIDDRIKICDQYEKDIDLLNSPYPSP